MNAEFPTLAEVIRQHRLVTYLDKSSGSLWIGSWPTRYRCECGWVSPEADCTRTDHPEHVQDVWREACTIRTRDELAALPLKTVVVDAVGIPRTKRHGNSHMPGGWTHAGNSPLTSTELADGRDMVVAWHPDWSPS